MLELIELRSGYGETQILHGLSLTVKSGSVLALLGRNGVGKSTTLKTSVGLLPLWGGDLRFEGASLRGMAPYDIARRGISYVPETRDIFPSLSVRENLELAANRFPCASGGWDIPAIVRLFPRLGERMQNGGSHLSGGEAQMLSIARALLMNPKLLILDEPTEGLAPIIVKLIHDTISGLKRAGLTIVLVSQNFGFATSLADEVAIISRGALAWKGSSTAVRADRDTQLKFLGI